MSNQKTLTFVLNDPPFETARSTTGLRLVDAAIRKGHNVNVFAYEGAVALAFTKQTPHGNGVHGRTTEEEDHPLPREWIASLLEAAKEKGLAVDWVNCGLCVDERGVLEILPGTRRGGPPDLGKFVEASDNTLVIPTR